MKDLLQAAKFLLLDLASTIFFLIVFLLTRNTLLSVALGVSLGLVQIGIQFVRRKPIDTMEWLSLFLVIAAGTATLLTDDPRFVLLKPSVIYVIVGVVMLRPGWMNRYLPEIVKAVAPDIAVIVGFIWAGLMFLSAAVNVVVALAADLHTWAVVMPVFGIVSKVIVFLGGFLAIRFVTVRRIRAMPAPQRDALLSSFGRSDTPPSGAKPA